MADRVSLADLARQAVKGRARKRPPLPAWAEGLTYEQALRAMEMMRQLPPVPETNTNRRKVLEIPYPNFGNGGLF